MNSRLEDNEAVGGQGGMYVANEPGGPAQGSLISGSRIANNRTAGHTGGVYYAGRPLTISDTAIVGNIAAAFAGGLSVAADQGSGTITIERSLIAGNQANEAGGLHVWYTDVVLKNTTVSGNVATTDGGGIEVVGTDGGLTLTNSTITQNSASNSGGVYLKSNRTLSLANSVIAGNTATTGGDLKADAGTVTSHGGNLIGDPSAANLTANTSDQVGTAVSPLDPQLGRCETTAGRRGRTYRYGPVR